MSGGREFGQAWEQIVQARARSNGLLILKNELAAHYIGGGGVRVSKSELDFKIARRGRPTIVGFFDAKTFERPEFYYTDLLAKKEPRDHQIQRAAMWNSWGVPSGFIVQFRSLDRISFFPGFLIARAGPGSKFRPEDGKELGNISSFDLRVLLDPEA